MSKRIKKAAADVRRCNRLYGESDNAQPEADYLFSELLETRSPGFGWEIKPHVHPGLLQVFFIKKGLFTFFEAEKKTRLNAPCLLLIPSTALHGFKFNEQVRGNILTMAESRYKSLISDMEVLDPANLKVLTISTFNSPYPAERISAIMDSIDEELALHEPGKQMMLRICLQQLLMIVHRLVQSDEQQQEEAGNSASRYYREFLKLMRDTGGGSSVSQLAGKLAISPVHLNRICKKMTGKSAGLLIQEHLVGEAKKYLAYTSYSVAEIAYFLHFEYPNYFARFFRKHTGLSPKAFRELE